MTTSSTRVLTDSRPDSGSRRTDVPPPLPLLLSRDFPPGELARDHRRGLLLHCARGLYAPLPDDGLPRWQSEFLAAEARILAVGATLPASAVIVRDHAALLLGASFLDMPRRVHVALPYRTSRVDRSPFTARHSRHYASDEVVIARGIRVTDHDRTAVDVARHSPFAHAAVVTSSLMRVACVPDRRERGPSEFRAEQFRTRLLSLICSEPNHRWNRRARVVIEACAVWTESPLEVLSLMAALVLGLPAPTLQKKVVINGSTYYVDAFFEGTTPSGKSWAVAMESDGYLKHEADRSSWVQQQQRDNDLLSAGIVPVHLTWEMSTDLRRYAQTVLPSFPAHVRESLRPDAAVRRLWSPGMP